MLNVTIIGCGAIGRGVIDILVDDATVCVAQIVTSPKKVEALREEFPDTDVVSHIEDLPTHPELLLECAGHRAVIEHVLPALKLGIDCVMCSIGALAATALPEKLEAAARYGGSQLRLVSGAIGAIDAIAAARIGGLTRVVYTGRKPLVGWKGTPAEEKIDLDNISEAARFFTGSAREAARWFPKNANVAATVSLAGLGLDYTEVHLIADPDIERNIHNVRAEGAFGELELTLSGYPLRSNPKTSALTVYSAVRSLCNRARPIAI